MPRNIVVTGASGGIGRATAIAFGRRKDTVVLVARGKEGLDGAAAEVKRAGGTAVVMSADVADADQCSPSRTASKRRSGRSTCG